MFFCSEIWRSTRYEFVAGFLGYRMLHAIDILAGARCQPLTLRSCTLSLYSHSLQNPLFKQKMSFTEAAQHGSKTKQKMIQTKVLPAVHPKQFGKLRNLTMAGRGLRTSSQTGSTLSVIHPGWSFRCLGVRMYQGVYKATCRDVDTMSTNSIYQFQLEHPNQSPADPTAAGYATN